MTVKIEHTCDRCHRVENRGYEYARRWYIDDLGTSYEQQMVTHLCEPCARAFDAWVEDPEAKPAREEPEDEDPHWACRECGH